MQYDFETIINRKNSGSIKWDLMLEQNPKVSEHIVPFSVADMELKNPPEIVEGLKTFLDESILGYTNTTDSYYESLLDWMEKKHGFLPKREWCIETPGVVPALKTMVELFSNPEDSVMIMTPVYYPFKRVVEENGRTVVATELLARGESYEIDFSDFEDKAKRPEVTLLILSSPHNPVGRVWSKEELMKIADICLENNVFILDDEIHFDLIMPGYTHISMGTFEKKYLDNCAICTAPSKTFNLAGMQVSNIFISNLEKRTKMRKNQGFFLLNAVGMKACELAYTKCEDWLNQLIHLIWENKEYVESFIRTNIPEVKVYQLEGTYLLWMDFRPLGMEAEELEPFMINEAELFFDEGYVFGEGGRGFERMNLACPNWVIREAMDRLRKAVTKYKEQTK
ncbi:MAG: MalY/PatB family protein [Velocimicrobium sp.]